MDGRRRGTHTTPLFSPLTFSASACSEGVDSAFRASMASRSGWSEPSGKASQNAQGRSSFAKEEVDGRIGAAPGPATAAVGRPYSAGGSVVMGAVREKENAAVPGREGKREAEGRWRSSGGQRPVGHACGRRPLSPRARSRLLRVNKACGGITWCAVLVGRGVPPGGCGAPARSDVKKRQSDLCSALRLQSAKTSMLTARLLSRTPPLLSLSLAVLASSTPGAATCSPAALPTSPTPPPPPPFSTMTTAVKARIAELNGAPAPTSAAPTAAPVNDIDGKVWGSGWRHSGRGAGTRATRTYAGTRKQKREEVFGRPSYGARFYFSLERERVGSRVRTPHAPAAPPCPCLTRSAVQCAGERGARLEHRSAGRVRVGTLSLSLSARPRPPYYLFAWRARRERASRTRALGPRFSPTAPCPRSSSPLPESVGCACHRRTEDRAPPGERPHPDPTISSILNSPFPILGPPPVPPERQHAQGPVRRPGRAVPEGRGAAQGGAGHLVHER